MNPTYYRVELDDPAIPSASSFSKSYFGPVSDIAAVMERMAQSGRYPDTVQAFKAFQNGDTEATHSVCFHKEKLMNPCTLIYKEHFVLYDITWEHENVWEHTYCMAADHICVDQILLQDGEQYYRCIRATFSALERMSNINGNRRRVGPRIWGSREIMQYFCGDHSIALYVLEERYSDLDTAMAHMGKPDLLDYGRICDEIFGDG